MDEFNGDEDAQKECYLECLRSSEEEECSLLPWGATRALFDAHCNQADSDELAAREAELLTSLDNLLLSGSPEDLNLKVDENGIIID